MISKHTEFSFNLAVNMMEDFSWCPVPECGQPAELNLVKNYGICTHCRFHFCIQCKQKYHFYKQCPLLKVQKEEAMSLVKENME